MMPDNLPGHDMYRFVSTGTLPPPTDIETLIAQAWAQFRDVSDGRNSVVYPALARQDPDLFGIAVVGRDGRVHRAGDAGHRFAIMSVSKPFLFALVAQEIGPRQAHARLGANATGRPFNSVEAVERSSDGRTNPMVNAGAIMATGLAPGTTTADKWAFIQKGLSGFAGRDLSLNAEVADSALATNFRNRGLANMLHGLGHLPCGPDEAVELYTRQCSLDVSACDLAVMGATLANGGINPLTGLRIVDADVCRYTLAVMATSGMYENSGDWLYEVGLPAKSGIGGGIVTVSPGKGGVGTFAPPLDAAGNSVKGQMVARYLSQQLGMDMFIARPI